MAEIYVNFANDSQVYSLWCWVALGTNIYNSAIATWPPGVPTLSPPPAQKKQDSVYLKSNRKHHGTIVNEDGNIRDSLNYLQMLTNSAGSDFQFVLNQISDSAPAGFQGLNVYGRPVVVTLDCGDLTHFVAISGADPTNNHVWIEDSDLGDGNIIEHDFEDFHKGYELIFDGEPVTVTGSGFQAVRRTPLATPSP